MIIGEILRMLHIYNIKNIVKYSLFTHSEVVGITEVYVSMSFFNSESYIFQKLTLLCKYSNCFYERIICKFKKIFLVGICCG